MPEAADIMTPAVVSVKPDQTIEEAVQSTCRQIVAIEKDKPLLC